MRRIDPLQSLSVRLTDSLEREVPIQREYYREVTSSDNSSGISATSSSPPSSLSRVSGSISQHGGQTMHKTGQLDELVGPVFLRQSSVRTVPSYSFFANGQSLLLWFRKSALVVAYDIATGQVQHLNVEQPTISAAAGARFCAVLSSHGAVRPAPQ